MNDERLLRMERLVAEAEDIHRSNRRRTTGLFQAIEQVTPTPPAPINLPFDPDCGVFLPNTLHFQDGTGSFPQYNCDLTLISGTLYRGFASFTTNLRNNCDGAGNCVGPGVIGATNHIGIEYDVALDQMKIKVLACFNVGIPGYQMFQAVGDLSASGGISAPPGTTPTVRTRTTFGLLTHGCPPGWFRVYALSYPNNDPFEAYFFTPGPQSIQPSVFF